MNHTTYTILKILFKLMLTGGTLLYTLKKAKNHNYTFKFKDFKLITSITIAILCAIILDDTASLFINMLD